MADSPYFDATYFDGTYFDVNTTTTGPVGGWHRRPPEVHPVPNVNGHAAANFGFSIQGVGSVNDDDIARALLE